jgi:hypothetical protein
MSFGRILGIAGLRPEVRHEADVHDGTPEGGPSGPDQRKLTGIVLKVCQRRRG